jgi:excisionase family DNA binding protein
VGRAGKEGGAYDQSGVYTTGRVAQILGVAPKTVTKWVDAGHMSGYRLPGSQDRRIYRTAVLAFAREHGMRHALRTLLSHQAAAVLGLDGLDVGLTVRDVLTGRGLTVTAARTCVEAAAGCRVVVGSPAAEGMQALRSLGFHLAGTGAFLLAVLPGDDATDDAAARLAAAGWWTTDEAGAALALANLLDGAAAPGKGGAA